MHRKFSAGWDLLNRVGAGRMNRTSVSGSSPQQRVSRPRTPFCTMRDLRLRSGIRTFLGLLPLLATTCSNDETSAGSKRNGVTLRFSGVTTDTIEAQITATITAEVRAANGKLLPDVIVGFGGLPAGTYPGRPDEAAAYVCVVSSTECLRNIAPVRAVTDANGRAEIRVRLGNIVGKMLIVSQTDVLPGSDTVAFTVTPGAPARIRAFSSDVLVDIGKTTSVSGSVSDRFGNPRTELPVFSLTAGSAASVDSATGVVRGLDMGTQRIYARRGTAVDSATLGVRPRGRLIGATSDIDAGIHMLSFDGNDDVTVLPPGPGISGFVRAASRPLNRISVKVATDTSLSGLSAPTFGVGVIDSAGSFISTIRQAGGFAEIVTTRHLADGSTMFIARPRDPAPSPNYPTIYRAARDGTLTKLVDIPTLVPQFFGADLSPDGTRVAFVSYTASRTNELRVMTIATGASIVISPEARAPTFSPTGDRVAYFVANTNVIVAPAVGIAVSGADGAGARTVNAGDYFGGLSWSPDGTMIMGRLAASRRQRIVRVADGAFVTLRILDKFGLDRNLYGVEWW